ncbi:PREDICTED: selenocysteine insertion sequence-binding protein 2 [Nanorana parkeri]|uniref:selenocysteine insertion sequence-binding protein 2 n=1 Tax=Nanorana parkeri TaxID=125878 RepID=UPI000854836B|nr:PREDICTED: selenocysteine insertion sequence-binding protein 2 [Nanorana parkeri]
MQPGNISQVSSTSPSSPVTWASKVKQPPKAMIPPTTSVKPVCSSPSIAKDSKSQGWNKMLSSPNLATETEAEEVVAKKKRKKKKKNKPSPSNEHSESVKFTNENIVIQEPPKFQDTEEFPDLMSSSGVAERGLRPENRSYSSFSQGPRGALESSKTKGSGKKSKTPVQLDLGGMLTALQQKQHIDKTKPSTKAVVLSVGGGVPVLPREPNNIIKNPQTKQGQAPHNPLDSSAPMVKKGKQREVPKAKKPTSLKKIILKEREQRKQLQGSVPQEAAQKVVEDHLDDAEGTVECQDVVSEEPLCSESPEDMEEKMESEVGCSASTNESLKNLPDATSVVPVNQVNTNLPKIHSRRFREYCSQVLSKEVDTCVTDLLKELVRFQDRLYLKDPVKAKTKRRLVMGLREVLKHLKLKKLKCVIISPNCEKIQSKGGLDDTLQTIISCACEQNVPFVFALNRKALGRCVNKAVPVSVVGIFSYDGAQDHFHKLYELTMQARQAYKDMVCSSQEDTGEGDEVESVLENSPHQPMEVTAKSAADEAEEPNYIKVWKRMLEEQYNPYTLSLEETVTNDMFNFHLS